MPTTRSRTDASRIPAQPGGGTDPGLDRTELPRPGGFVSTVARTLDSEFLSGPSLSRQARILGLFLVAALVALWPVLHDVGWPVNHEQGNMFARTEIYAEHLRHLDFFPVWSDSDAYGMGTPLPAYYHKLFYWLSGGLVVLGWPLKAAVIGALVALMLVGMYGMRACLLRLGTPSRIANLGAIALVFSTYAFTDWLVRGAMAEFAGMMLVPWIIWWALDLVGTGRAGLHIAPIIVLAYLAHNIVAFFGLFTVGGAFVVALITRTDRFALARGFALAMALTFAALVPLLLVLRPFSGDYDISRIVPSNFLPRNNLHPIGRYFYDHHYRWSTTDWQDYTISVGSALWLAAALVLLHRATLFVARRGPARGGPFMTVQEVLLAGLVTVFLALQTKTFVGVYDLPGFKFIQFPWRLLAFITPALILLVFSLASRSPAAVPATGRMLTPACTLLVVALVAASPVRTHKQPVEEVGAYTKDRIQNQDGSSFGDILVMAGEYLPVLHDGPARLSAGEVSGKYAELSRHAGGIQVLSGPCTVREPHRSFEASRRTFELTCTGPGVVALPVSYNSVSTVRLAGKKLPYHRIDRDPRIVVDIPGATSGQLTVDLPTLWRVLAGLVR